MLLLHLSFITSYSGHRRNDEKKTKLAGKPNSLKMLNYVLEQEERKKERKEEEKNCNVLKTVVYIFLTMHVEISEACGEKQHEKKEKFDGVCCALWMNKACDFQEWNKSYQSI